MSQTIYIELEGYMIYQNDTLDAADNFQPPNIFKLTYVNLTRILGLKMVMFGQQSALLVILKIHIELKWHMIYQNDTLDEADNLQLKMFLRLS